MKIKIDLEVPDKGIWAIMLFDDGSHHVFTEDKDAQDDWEPRPGRMLVHKDTGEELGPIKTLTVPYDEFINGFETLN